MNFWLVIIFVTTLVLLEAFLRMSHEADVGVCLEYTCLEVDMLDAWIDQPVL